MKKTYLSPHRSLTIWGGTKLGSVSFTNGRFSTDDPAKQKLIENSTWFQKNEIVLDEGEEVEETFECPVCDAVFETKAALNGHLTGHKRKGEF